MSAQSSRQRSNLQPDRYGRQNIDQVLILLSFRLNSIAFVAALVGAFLVRNVCSHALLM
jgi:hypothetical protein